MASWEANEAALRGLDDDAFDAFAGTWGGWDRGKPVTRERRETYIRNERHKCVNDAAYRNQMSVRLGLPTDEQDSVTSTTRALHIAEQSLEIGRASAEASRSSAVAAKRTANATCVLVGVTFLLAVIPVLTYCDSRNAANQRQGEHDGQHGTQAEPGGESGPVEPDEGR